MSILLQDLLILDDFFNENFTSVKEPSTNSWYDVPTTQMSKYILSVSAGASFWIIKYSELHYQIGKTFWEW